MANKSLYVHNGLTVGQSVQIGGSSGNISTTGIVTSTNTTNSVSTVTGALQIAGGVGIGRDLWVGGTIYGASIAGSVTTATNATNAANVATVAQTANAAYFPTFVDSNNAASANELVYTTSSFSINPSTGFVGIGITPPTAKLHVVGTATDRVIINMGGNTIPTSDAALNVWGNAFGTSTVVRFSFSDGSAGNRGGFTFSDIATPGDWVVPRMDMIQSFGGASEIRSLLTTQDTSWAGMKFTSQTTTGTALTTSPSFVWFNNVSEQMRITGAGDVGIGTVSPSTRLDVTGGARITGVTTVTNTTAASSTVTGALIVNGGIGVGNNVYIAGALFATTKSFLIDHPTKPGKKLRYGSLEGPENGVYIRGRTQETIIELPDYWTKLVDPDSVTVNLTAIGKTKVPSVKKIEGNKLYLNKPWFSKIDCYYIIFAERADIEKLEAEI